MKTYFNFPKVIILIVCILFFFLGVSPLGAAAPPLPDLMKEIALDFSKLEEEYREGEWDEAKSHLKEINSKYAKLLPSLLKSAGSIENRKKITQFGTLLKALNKQISAQDKDKIFTSFGILQDLVVQFVEFYSYQQHPFLEAFHEELEEIFEKGTLNFEHIEDETEEMEPLIKRITPSLAKRGVSQEKIETFLGLLEAIEEAAVAKNEEATMNALKEVYKLNGEIMATQN